MNIGIDSLAPHAFAPIPLGGILPRGWLARQLRIQADGLSGNLDVVWKDIRESRWLGKPDGDGWERTPYWLDGFVPMAFLLNDEQLKAKARLWMDYILDHPQEDGWLGPDKSNTEVDDATGQPKVRDPWPIYVMLKVLRQWEEATGDPRAVPAMMRFLETLRAQLAQHPLESWNRMRWQDLAITAQWLFDKTGAAWLLELGATLREQGYDWMAHFKDLPIKERVPKWEHESHVVNNAMGAKTAAVIARQWPDDAIDAAFTAISSLDQYHGPGHGDVHGRRVFRG